MADYLIPSVDHNCREDWRKLAQKAQVLFTKEQRRLAENLFDANWCPKMESGVVSLNYLCGSTIPSTEPLYPDMSSEIPVHPFVVLTLMAGITGGRAKGHDRFQGSWVVSPYPLRFPNRTRFYFVLERENLKSNYWLVRFLKEGEMIPRAQYVYSYRKDKAPSSYFIPDAEGHYGPYVTTR